MTMQEGCSHGPAMLMQELRQKTNRLRRISKSMQDEHGTRAGIQCDGLRSTENSRWPDRKRGAVFAPSPVAPARQPCPHDCGSN